MSRGLGEVQRTILKVVEGNTGRSASWVGWHVADKLQGTDAGGLRRSFYSAFRRALGLLRAPGASSLVVVQRTYRSLDEVVAEYPYRARTIEMRDDRLALLPKLAAFGAEHGPRFSRVAIERHVMQSARPGAGSTEADFAKWKGALKTWSGLDRRILAHLATPDDQCRSILVELLVKGREFFTARSLYSLDRPLWTITGDLERVSGHDEAVAALVGEVSQMLETWAPRRETARGSLKSQLYAFVDFGIHRRVGLLDETWQHLWAKEQPLLKSRFGASPPTPPRRGFFTQTPARVERVDKVITRDVLREDSFLTVGA